MIRFVANSVQIIYFPERFFPLPVSLKSTVDGLEFSEGMCGSLFQAIILAKYVDKLWQVLSLFAEGGQKREKHYSKRLMLEVWQIPLNYQGNKLSQKKAWWVRRWKWQWRARGRWRWRKWRTLHRGGVYWRRQSLWSYLRVATDMYMYIKKTISKS